MGSTFEVVAWVKGDNEYHDLTVWRGEHLLAALVALFRAKRQHGYVRLEWRR